MRMKKEKRAKTGENEERNLKKKEQETLQNSQFRKNVTNMIFRVSYFILLLKSVT